MRVLVDIEDARSIGAWSARGFKRAYDSALFFSVHTHLMNITDLSCLVNSSRVAVSSVF